MGGRARSNRCTQQRSCPRWRLWCPRGRPPPPRHGSRPDSRAAAWRRPSRRSPARRTRTRQPPATACRYGSAAAPSPRPARTPGCGPQRRANANASRFRSIRPPAASPATTEQGISVSSVHSHGALRAGSASGSDALPAPEPRAGSRALRAPVRTGSRALLCAVTVRTGGLTAGTAGHHRRARDRVSIRAPSGQASARAPSGGSGGHSSAPGATGRERASTSGSGAAAATGNGGGVPP